MTTEGVGLRMKGRSSPGGICIHMAQFSAASGKPTRTLKTIYPGPKKEWHLRKTEVLVF